MQITCFLSSLFLLSSAAFSSFDNTLEVVVVCIEFVDLLDAVDDGLELFQLLPQPLFQPESSKSHPSVGCAIKINYIRLIIYKSAAIQVYYTYILFLLTSLQMMQH